MARFKNCVLSGTHLSKVLYIGVDRIVLARRPMNAEYLRHRTKKFAIEIVRLCRQLPADWETRVLGTQLLRSGTAVAANYRASCRGRSPKEFCAKLGVVAEEADESLLWLELLPIASPGIAGKEHKGLLKEADELTAIFTASYKTARTNLKKRNAAKKRRPRSNGEITKSPDHKITKSAQAASGG